VTARAGETASETRAGAALARLEKSAKILCNTGSIQEKAVVEEQDDRSQGSVCSVCGTAGCDSEQLEVHKAAHRSGCRYECRYCLQVPAHFASIYEFNTAFLKLLSGYF
jgi:hypothetical protein